MSVVESYRFAMPEQMPEHLKLPFVANKEGIRELDAKMTRLRPVVCAVLGFVGACIARRVYQYSILVSFGIFFAGLCYAGRVSSQRRQRIQEIMSSLDNFVKAAKKAHEIAGTAILEKLQRLERVDSMTQASNCDGTCFRQYFHNQEACDTFKDSPDSDWRNAIVQHWERSIQPFTNIILSDLNLTSASFLEKLKEVKKAARALNFPIQISEQKDEASGTTKIVFTQKPWERAIAELSTTARD